MGSHDSLLRLSGTGVTRYMMYIYIYDESSPANHYG